MIDLIDDGTTDDYRSGYNEALQNMFGALDVVYEDYRELLEHHKEHHPACDLNIKTLEIEENAPEPC